MDVAGMIRFLIEEATFLERMAGYLEKPEGGHPTSMSNEFRAQAQVVRQKAYSLQRELN